MQNHNHSSGGEPIGDYPLPVPLTNGNESTAIAPDATFPPQTSFMSTGAPTSITFPQLPPQDASNSYNNPNNNTFNSFNRRTQSFSYFGGSQNASYYSGVRPVNPKGRVNGKFTLPFYQTYALIRKSFAQKIRGYAVTLAEILVPVIFVAVFAIVWAITGNPEKVQRDYYTSSDLTTVRVPSALEALTCNNVSYNPRIAMVEGYPLCINTAWRVRAQNILGLPVQNGILFTASFGNPPPSQPIPRAAYPLTLPSGWRPYLNAYLYEFESGKQVDDSGTLLDTRGSDGEKGAQPFVIKSLDEHILMMLLGAVGEINDDVTIERTVLSGVASRFKLFFSPNTAEVAAFITYLNANSKLIEMINGGVFNSLEDALAASADVGNARQSWAIIDILEINRDKLDFGIYVNRTTIPDTTFNIYDKYAGGYPDTYHSELYLTSGYLTLQRVIYEYYITQILQAGGATLRSGDGRDGTATAAPSVPRQFLFMPMGHPEYEDLSFLNGAGEYAPLMIALAFLFPVSQLTKALVVEKETKLRETLFIMGLGRVQYHASWIFVHFIQFLISAALCTILLHVTFLHRSDAGLIFLILATYALSAVAFSGLFASFFSNSKAASFVAPLVFLIFATPFFLLQAGSSYSVEVVFSFLSPSAVGNAFLRIIEYEFSSGLHQHEFSHNRSTVVGQRLTVAAIWVFLLFDSIIYFILMVYFDLVIPSGIGTPYHPLFFIIQPHKKYARWRKHKKYLADKKQKELEGGEIGPDGIRRRIQPTDSVLMDDGSLRDMMDEQVDEEHSPTLSRRKKRELSYDGRDPNGFFENDDLGASQLGTSTNMSYNHHSRVQSRDERNASNVTAPFVVEHVRAGPPSNSVSRHEREGSTASISRRGVLPNQNPDQSTRRDSRMQLSVLRRQGSISFNSTQDIAAMSGANAPPASPTSRRNYDLSHVKVRGLVKEFERNGGKKKAKKGSATELDKDKEMDDITKRGGEEGQQHESIAARDARLREEGLFRAVDGIRLDFGIGEINVLLGHNGAGKTTTINLMCGMLKPTAGDCFIFGHSITNSPQEARREIGICPQHNILYPDLTCEQHLELFARIKGYHGKALNKRVDEMLESVGMEDKRKYLSTQLSGGQKRKLSIALAFVGDAKLVFLDEPTAGVDVTARRTIWDFIKKEAADRSVILTTHYMDEADLLGDKIAIMSDGRLKCRGSSLFLKSRLGVGYTLSLSLSRSLQHRHSGNTRDPNNAQSQPLSSVDLGVIICDRITDLISDCEIASFVPGELVMRLPLHEIGLFPQLLRDLETHSKQLGIRGMSMALTTLEDVFMRITNDEVPLAPVPDANGKKSEVAGGGQAAIGDNPSNQAVAPNGNQDFLSPASPITLPPIKGMPAAALASPSDQAPADENEHTLIGSNGDPSLYSGSRHVQFDPRPPTAASPPVPMSPYPSPETDIMSFSNGNPSPSPPPTESSKSHVRAAAVGGHNDDEDPFDKPIGSNPLMKDSFLTSAEANGDHSTEPIGTLFDVQAILSGQNTPRPNIAGGGHRRNSVGTTGNNTLSSNQFDGESMTSPSISFSQQPDRKQGESVTSLTSPSERVNVTNRQRLAGGTQRIRKFRSTSTQPLRSNPTSANVSSSVPQNGTGGVGNRSLASGGETPSGGISLTNHPSRISSPYATDGRASHNNDALLSVSPVHRDADGIVKGWDASPNPREDGGIMSTDTLYLDPITSLTSLDRALGDTHNFNHQEQRPASAQQGHVEESPELAMEDQDEINTLAVWRARKTGEVQHRTSLSETDSSHPELVKPHEKPEMSRLGKSKKNIQQTVALLKKRALNLKRDKKTIVLQIIFPVICVLASMLLRLIAYPDAKILMVSDEASLYRSPSEFIYDDTCRGGMLSFQLPPGDPALGENGTSQYATFSSATSAEQMSAQLKDEFNLHAGKERFQAFYCEDLPMRNRLSSTYVSTLPSTVVTLFANYTSIHQPAIAISSFYKKMINRYLAQTTDPETNSDFIQVSNRVGVLPASEYEEKFHNAKNVGFAAIIIILPFVLIPSTFIYWIVKEKQCKSRHLQTIAGLTFWTYWISNLLFDMLCMIVTAALVIAVFFIFGSDEYVGWWEPFVTLVLLFIFFGISSILISYVMSFAFQDASTAQNFSLLLNFVCGFLLVLAIFIMNLIKEAKPYARYIKWFFRLSPAYCLGESISTLATDGVLSTVTGDTARPLSLESCGWPLIYMALESLFFAGLLIYIDHPSMRSKRRQKSIEAERKRRHARGIMSPLSPVTVTTDTGGIPTIRKLKPESGNKPTIATTSEERNNESITSEDSDVRAERQEIESGARDTTDSIIVRGLTKTYPNGTKAVRGMSFGVRKGEILALLGVNGAGKTTTMSMICQEVDPTSGSISINGTEVADHASETLHAVGYCPQFDALIDTMTPKEHLELFAGIRGIYRKDVDNIVERLMQVIGLTQYKDVLSEKLSGGNKRKLSVAIALLGGPDVILFDEPSAGMDPLARRTLWKVIEIITQFCSVILTTHHLEEVEALADRVGIMAKGEMKCIGDKTALKNKFGSGFEVNIRLIEQKSTKSLKPKDRYTMANGATDLKDIIAQEEGRAGGGGGKKTHSDGKSNTNHELLRRKVKSDFPSATYTKLPFHSATILFPKNSTTLSQIFTFMESVKTETGIREYAVSQASIESIFMDINKQVNEAEGGDEGDSPVKKPDAE